MPTSRRSWLGVSGLRAADSGRLFRYIDSDRAPSNAPATSYASRSSKLIDPGAKFVRHPLPVARLERRPHAPAVEIAEVQGVAGIPSSHALRVLAREIDAVF